MHIKNLFRRIFTAVLLFKKCEQVNVQGHGTVELNMVCPQRKLCSLRDDALLYYSDMEVLNLCSSFKNS